MMMQFSFRDDKGTKVTISVEDMSIEQLGKYMEHIEGTLHIPVDTSKLFKTDRRVAS